MREGARMVSSASEVGRRAVLCGLTTMDQVTNKYICEAETVTEPHEMSSWVNMPTPRIL